ncbi:MAG: hypothetical protein JXQ93_05095 [Flavobacteriaceae bacterium]
MVSEERGKVEITENLFKYKTSHEHQNAYFKSKSFEIPIDELKVVGIYYTMILDDDANILVFVDQKNRKYFISVDFDLQTDSISKILESFKLDENILSPNYENYDKGNSYVLYPQSLTNVALYRKKNFIESFLWGVFKVFQIKYIGDGLLSKEVKDFTKK